MSVAGRRGSQALRAPPQGFASNQPRNVEVAPNGQKFLVNAIVGDSDNAPLEVTLSRVEEVSLATGTLIEGLMVMDCASPKERD